jgi:hypothetical protein
MVSLASKRLWQGRTFMKDIIFIAVTLAFFAIALAYVRFCDRIR